MEVEKLLKLAIEHLSDYLRTFLATVRNPKLEFQPEEVVQSNLLNPRSDSKVVKARLSPKLFSFLLLSICIGSVLNTNIPGRRPAPEFVITMVIVLACWFLFSFLVYVICKVFGGRGTLLQTLSLNLQISAAIYVLSSFGTFLWGTVITKIYSGIPPDYLQGHIGEILIKEPIYAYFVVQFILILVYLPIANKRIHRLNFSGLYRTISRGVFSVALLLAKITLFYIVIFVLSLIMAELSKINYQIHGVPGRGAEITSALPGESEFGNSLVGFLETSEDSLNEHGSSRNTLPRLRKTNARKPRPSALMCNDYERLYSSTGPIISCLVPVYYHLSKEQKSPNNSNKNLSLLSQAILDGLAHEQPKSNNILTTSQILESAANRSGVFEQLANSVD